MRLKKTLLYILVSSITSLHTIPCAAAPAEKISLGTWITVFSQERVLESKENIDRMLAVCERSGITDVYMQVYRADRAYFDSAITDASPYKALREKAGVDPLRYLIDRAEEKGIRVHAWLNMLCLSQNDKANVISKFGQGVLTRDQHGRTPLPAPKDQWDKYYIREDQLFLEPGDWRIRAYVLSVAEEVVKKYPGLAGLHLDYIRYPAAVPFIPGSRFASHGLYYGYTDVNILAFKKATGLDPRTMEGTPENFRKWDAWHRDRVSFIVREVSKKARAISPDILISCTTVSSPERTYYATCQDWTKWLDENIADYVTPMNYSEDPFIVELNSKAMLGASKDKRIHMGIGAYMLKGRDELLKKQILAVKKLSPKGIIIFSYDDIAASPDLQKFLGKEFGKL